MFLDTTNNTPKFYGRRQGRKIRKAKTSLLDAFLPQIKINDNTKFDAQTMFGQPVEKVYLEIGFGNGEHLAGQAQKHPNIGFIGAEVFKNGVANLLSIITGIKEGSNLPENFVLTDNRTDNIRVFDDDIIFAKDRIGNFFNGETRTFMFFNNC